MALCMLNEISKKATMIMEDTAKLLEAIAARERETENEKETRTFLLAEM
jgi:hypothetical protein